MILSANMQSFCALWFSQIRPGSWLPGISYGEKQTIDFLSFCACMNECATLDDDTVRTSSSFSLLCIQYTTQQVRTNLRKAFFPPLTTDNRPLPSLISHFQQTGPKCLQHTLPSLRSLVFVFFIKQSKQQYGLVWVCFCSPWRRSARLKLSHVLLQPLSFGFIFIEITNNKPLRARCANRTAHSDSLLCSYLKC